MRTTTMCEISQDSFICENVSFDSEGNTQKRCVPTQTQIREQLGSKLSDVFFEFLGTEARNYLGLEPPLSGFDAIWINPEARLENKVSITPVPEPQVLHLKAMTHGSVLEVGQKYIAKLENKHRLEMEEALRNQAEELEEEFKRRLASAGDSNIVDGGGQYKKIVGTLMEHFDSCFNDLVKTTQLRMRKECQLKVKEEREEVAAYMLTRLQEEIERRDLELCSEFHDILLNELNKLATRYIRKINNEREIAVQLIQETVRNYEKMMQDLKIEMEFNNVVDVCRAITQERLLCSEIVRQIENDLRSKQNTTSEYIEQLKSENATLQKMSTERLKRLIQWRKKVRELLQEFQRFINFALKAVPGQSEFLLDMEKLMLKKFPEDSFLLPEDYMHFQNCLKGKVSCSEDLMKEEREEELEKEPNPPSDQSEIIEETESTLEREQTPAYCHSPGDLEDLGSGLTFDYYKFKSMLIRRFAYNLSKPKHKRKPQRAVCVWKKKKKATEIDRSSELYQTLTLAGEHEKEHLANVDCFLSRRLKAVQKICEDDPEFAKVILGCSD